MEHSGQETWMPRGGGVFQEISKHVLQMPIALPTHGTDSAKDTVFASTVYVSFSSWPLALKNRSLHHSFETMPVP